MNLISISFEHSRVYFDDDVYYSTHYLMKIFSEDMILIFASFTINVCQPRTQSLGWPPLGDISPEKEEF